MGKFNNINSLDELHAILSKPLHPVIGTSNFCFFKYTEKTMILFGAPTGVGKSWVSCMEIARLLKQGKSVFLIHTEMSIDDYLSRLCRCPGLLTDEERTALVDGHFDSISVGGFDANGDVPYPNLYSALEALKNDDGIDVVFIDYINSYYTPSPNKSTSNHMLTQNFSRYLDKYRSNPNTHTAYFCLCQAVRTDKKTNTWDFNGDHNLLQTFDLAMIMTPNQGDNYSISIRKSRYDLLETNDYQVIYNKKTNTIESVRAIFDYITSNDTDVNSLKGGMVKED